MKSSQYYQNGSTSSHKNLYIYPTGQKLDNKKGGAGGVMVIVVGNGHGNTSSNPGWKIWPCVICCPSGGVG